MTQKELNNQIIAYLYAIDKKTKSNMSQSFSLRGIIQSLGETINAEKLRDTARYLDAKGYMNANYILGDILVSITTNGIIYVEEQLDEVVTRIEPTIENQVKKQEVDELRKPVFALLSSLKKSVSQRYGKKTDLTKDIDIIKLELEKFEPDTEVLNLKTNQLERMVHDDYTRELKYMLNLVY